MLEAREPALDGSSTCRRAFVHNHIVSFEETNLVGNVYFSRHVAWQGVCREMFLREHAPEVISSLSKHLRLVTIKTTCDYFCELFALDEINIEMRLAYVRSNRIGLDFAYFVRRDNSNELAAEGFQEIGCFSWGNGKITPCAVPDALAKSLRQYSVEKAHQ